MRTRILLGVALVVAGAGMAAAQAPAKSGTTTPAAKPAYKKDLPAALTKKAKVAEAAAATAALAKVPGGKIQGVELEEEGGKLIYSYDISVTGKKGIEEVHVDAMSGAVISSEHEDAAAEKKEADDDAKAAKGAKAATKAPAKKPDSTTARKKP